jgi:Sap, sulfolipid-1-addressing protein
LLSLVIAVVAIALPDSVNPTLIAAELLVAAGPRPGIRALAFTIAAGTVTMLAGFALALGLGDLIVSLLPKPGETLKYALITAAGAVLALGGLVIWIRRRALAAHAPSVESDGVSHGSPIALGAGVAGIELLTAFPYFAAIALIVGASVSVPAKALLIVLYCVVYTLPLIAIAVVFIIMRDRAEAVLRPPIEWLFERWPVVVGPLAAALGVGLVIFGLARLGVL